MSDLDAPPVCGVIQCELMNEHWNSEPAESFNKPMFRLWLERLAEIGGEMK